MQFVYIDRKIWHIKWVHCISSLCKLKNWTFYRHNFCLRFFGNWYDLSRIDNKRVRLIMRYLFARYLGEVCCFLRKGIFLFFICSASGCVETSDVALYDAVSLISDGQKIIISAPKGFCIDQRQSNRAAGSTILVVIDCVKMDDSSDVTISRRPLSALLTATIADFQSPDLTNISRLEELLTRKPGINSLSRANTNALVKVHKIEKNKNVLIFLIEQRVSDIDVLQSNFFFRAFFFVEGRIISMTASNFSDNVASRKILKKLIIEFAKNTLMANQSSNQTGI